MLNLKLSIVYVMNKLIEIKGFHTCSYRQGDCKAELVNLVPFLCNPHKVQWLGIGYYFWTDSPHFAHEWGKFGYSGEYSINQFSIIMNRDKLLDLIGTVSDQLKFQNFIQQLFNTLERILDKNPEMDNCRIRQKLQRVRNGVVSTVIELSREFKLLDFWAIKAADIPKSSQEYRFKEKGRSEILVLPTRQQVVIYEEAKECIIYDSWIYPVESHEE